MNGATAYIAAIGYVAVPVPHRMVGRPRRAAGFLPAGDAGARLRAKPRRLLHVVDLLRLGRPRLLARPRLPADLHRPGPRHRSRLGVRRAHRQSRAHPEPDDRRRLRLGPLRQVAGGRRDCGADRAGRLGALRRPAAQGRLDHAPDGRRFARQIAADAGQAIGPVLPRDRAGARRLRHRFRHPAASIRRSARTA